MGSICQSPESEELNIKVSGKHSNGIVTQLNKLNVCRLFQLKQTFEIENQNKARVKIVLPNSIALNVLRVFNVLKLLRILGLSLRYLQVFGNLFVLYVSQVRRNYQITSDIKI